MTRRLAHAAIAIVAAAVLGFAVTPFAPPGHAAGSGINVPVAVQGASLSNLTVQPLALSPAFDPGISDYVVHCTQALNALQLTLTGNGAISVGWQRGSTLTLPVYLSENQAVVVTAPDPASPSTTDTYWIRCLPHDFPALNATSNGAPRGLYYTSNLGTADGSALYVMVLDEHGTPVWYQHVSTQAVDVLPLPGDVIAWTNLTGPGIGAQLNAAATMVHLDPPPERVGGHLASRVLITGTGGPALGFP